MRHPQETTTIDDGSKEMWLQASRFSYLGIFFGVAIFIGYSGGRWLDARFHLQPWMTILGTLFGIAAGFKELYRLASKYLKDQEKQS